MTPEETARAYQFRDGFNLVDYGEVGLPIFRLTIEGVTTAFRTLPTIQEFVMRCLYIGETREDDIARMLGLNQAVVSNAINTLITEGYASREIISADLQSFKLSNFGEERLLQERLEITQEEMLVVDYDAIRRIPVRLVGTSVVRASELKAHDSIEMRPYPAEAPRVSELVIPEVTRVLRRQRGEDFRRTVLSLKRIVRRSNVFREAVALVFAAEKGEEVQIAFAIDGKLSAAHERSFAENGGPRKMGLIRALTENDGKTRLERVVGREVVRAAPNRQDSNAARLAYAEAEAEVRSIRPAAELGGRSNPSVAALRAAKDKLSIAKHALESAPIRSLACFEQGELLEEALANARTSIYVTTAGLQPVIVNGFMLRQIDRLSEARVEVVIATQLTPLSEQRGGRQFGPLFELTVRNTRRQLRLIAESRPGLFFLIQDDELAVVSNKPFLGEVSRRSGFMRTAGIVVRRPEYVRLVREAMTSALTRGEAHV